MECVRFIFLWLAVVLVPVLGLSAELSHNQCEINSETVSLFEENGKVGLKGDDGRILIPAHYEAIGWSDGKLAIIDNVVGYRSDGLWGLISTSNKVLTPAEFLDLRPAEGSLLIAQKKSQGYQRPSFGIIDVAGKTMIPFLYDGIQVSNMRAVVMSRSRVNRFRFGLADLSHRLVIPIMYQRIYAIGSLRYAVENFENKTAIFSEAGDQLTGFTIDSISAFKKNLAIIYQDDRQGLINRQGQLILKPEYGEVRLTDNGVIQVRSTDAWYFLDGENNLSREFRADGLQSISPNHYIVRAAGKFQLTDNAFKALHEGHFSWLGPFENSSAAFGKNSRVGVIASSGRILIEPAYHQVVIDKTFLRVCLEPEPKPRWALVGIDGKQASEKQYEYIGPFNGQFYPVKNRGYWGAVNASGEEIVTCVHDSLLQHTDNYIAVKFKGQYGVIDFDETWVVTPQENHIKVLNADAYLEYAAPTTFLKSMGGRIIYFSDNHLEYTDGFLREELSNGAHWLIDMNGIIIDRSHQPDGAEKIFTESEGLRAIIRDGKYGFIDDAGRLRIANRYEEARPFRHGLAAIMIRGKWGFINHQEKLVVQPVYDHVEDFTNGMAIVKQENLFGLIDSTGKLRLPVRYDDITINNHNRYILRQGGVIGLADDSGRVIVNPKYDEIIDPGNGFFIVGRDEKFGALTMKGVSTIPMVYDGLTFDPHHNQFIGQKKSDWKTLDVSQSDPQN